MRRALWALGGGRVCASDARAQYSGLAGTHSLGCGGAVTWGCAFPWPGGGWEVHVLWTARMCESDLDVMRGGADLGADGVWRLMPKDEVGKWVVGCGRYVQMWLVR